MQAEDILRALTESPFFQAMPADERVALAREGAYYLHGDGDELFRPRAVPTALYLVLEGLVEISRVDAVEDRLETVAYVGPGSVLGASKIITATPFTSLARFPEGGATLQWSRTALLRRLYRSRDLSMHYLHNLAHRLEGTFASLGGRSSIKLGGNLDHFDLPTILQTVVDSRRTGVLSILEASGQAFGVIHVHDGLAGPVRCGALTGEEALLEIVISPPERGSFSFASRDAPDDTVHHFQVPRVLLDAARLQDEYRRLREQVPGTLNLHLATRQLAWDGDIPVALAERIWEAVGNGPIGWLELAERLPYSRAHVATAVATMLREGILTVDPAAR